MWKLSLSFNLCSAYIHFYCVNTSLEHFNTHVEENPQCLVPKHPSDTRWSARADATEAIFRGYRQFQSALQELVEDDDQNGLTKHEASTLASYMATIEIAFMCELWNDILHRFNCYSKLLHSLTIELSSVIGLLTSFDTYIDECREKFCYYHQQASGRCGNSIYKSDSQRARVHRKTIHDGEATSVMDEKTGQEKFKLNTFPVSYHGPIKKFTTQTN